MKKSISIFFSGIFAFCFCAGAHAACLKQNFNQCLDSACAINIGTNPAARCQLCGTSDAGKDTSGMSAITLGMSAKNTLTAAQLKSAPSSPAERYAWAIKECSKKINECTADDTDEYDKLIEQSCRAASIEIKMASAQKSVTSKKDKQVCESEINICIRDEKKCNTDFSLCRDDTDFNRVFSECSVASSGCSEFTNDIRTANLTARDNAVKNSELAITKLVERYKSERQAKLESAKSGCANNSAYDKCVSNVCAQNMKNGCAPEFSSEKVMAQQLCKFQKTACERLR